MPLRGGTSERLGNSEVEVDTENRNTDFADSPHLDTPAFTDPSRQATLPVSEEVEIQNNLMTQCAQQSLVSSQLSQGESEQADLSGVASSQPFNLKGDNQSLCPITCLKEHNLIVVNEIIRQRWHLVLCSPQNSFQWHQ